MKAIKSSLLLLVILFSLGTFANAQFPGEPCTQENIEGEWLESVGSRIAGDVRWGFVPELPPENGGGIFCISDTNCSNIYPDGNPLQYTFESSGEITILWSRRFDSITYPCFRIADTMTFVNFNGSPRGFEFLLLDGLGNEQAESVPTLSEWGLIAMAAVFGLVGFMVMRRKRVTA